MKAVFILLTLLSIGGAHAQNAGESSNPAHRWSVKSPDCSQSTWNGVTIETINAAGLRVEVTLRDTGSKMRADVFIENHRGDRVEVRPEQFRLAITDPSYKELKYNDPDRLARSIQRRAAWSGGLVALGGAMQTRTTTSQTTESGTITANGPFGQSAGTYNGASTTTTTAPDDEARRRADAQVQQISGNARNKIAGLQSVALRANTLFPSKSISGAVFFDRGKAKQAVLTVVVDSDSFEFPFSWKK